MSKQKELDTAQKAIQRKEFFVWLINDANNTNIQGIPLNIDNPKFAQAILWKVKETKLTSSVL